MSPEKTTKNEVRPGERIAKVMARAGLCSRRDAEAWIEAGRVSVNGEKLTSAAFNVGPDDGVLVDGQPLVERQRTRLFAFHKPRGLVTTSHDPEGRRTVFEALPVDLPRVVTIGRLDINTEGLLLLTNDGGLARVLELPETGWLRRYRVRAHGDIEQSALDALKDGVTVDGVHYAGIEARLERNVGSNVWLIMGLREGKNREIKRVLEHLGLQVTRLIRISFGPFELADLPEGAVAEVPTRVLRDQLGLRLAKKAEADFDAPIFETPPPPKPERVRAGPPRTLREGDGEEAAVERPARSREDRPTGPDRGSADQRARGTPPPRKRKHISILRAEAREEKAEARRRTERSETKDRRGREVKVERISTVRAAEPTAEARPARSYKPRGEFRPEGGERKRFGGGSAGDRPARPPRAREDSRTEGGERKPFRSAPTGDRPARPPRARDDSRFGGGERKPFHSAPTGDRPARPPRAREDSRSEGAERKPFRSAPAGERPARAPRPREDSRSEGGERKRFGGAPQGDRPDRAAKPRGDFRAEGGERKPFRGAPAGDRPARPPRAREESRSEGGERKRFGAGDRPARPSQPRSEGGKRFERKPDGDRPARPPRSGGSEGGRRPPPKGGSGARPPRKRP